jgi:hypothetical protein
MTELEIALAHIEAAYAAGKITEKNRESLIILAPICVSHAGTLMIWEGAEGYCAYTGDLLLRREYTRVPVGDDACVLED